MATNPLSEFMTGVKKLWTVATGAAADNSAVSGNPLLIGGRYSTTPATRHDGDVATIETDSQGRVLTVVSGSKERVLITSTTLATTVAAGVPEATNILATAGSLATILRMSFYIPAISGASSGTHMLQLDYGSPSGIKTSIFRISSAYNADITVDSAKGLVGTLSTSYGFQSLATLQDYLAGKLLMFGPNSSDKLVLTYTNNADVQQAGTRTLYIVSNEKAVTW